MMNGKSKYVTFCLDCELVIVMEPKVELFTVHLCPGCYKKKKDEVVVDKETLGLFLNFHQQGEPSED